MDTQYYSARKTPKIDSQNENNQNKESTLLSTIPYSGEEKGLNINNNDSLLITKQDFLDIPYLEFSPDKIPQKQMLTPLTSKISQLPKNNEK